MPQAILAAETLTRDEAIATLALIAQRHVHRLGDDVEASYRDGRSYNRKFPEKARYERALMRVGAARQVLGV